MALLIVFKSFIGCKAAEDCRVWLQGLAWVWPELGQGLARVWLQGLVSGIGCRAAGLQGCRVVGFSGFRVAGL